MTFSLEKFFLAGMSFSTLQIALSVTEEKFNTKGTSAVSFWSLLTFSNSADVTTGICLSMLCTKTLDYFFNNAATSSPSVSPAAATATMGIFALGLRAMRYIHTQQTEEVEPPARRNNRRRQDFPV